jgi:hypothetical protein
LQKKGGAGKESGGGVKKKRASRRVTQGVQSIFTRPRHAVPLSMGAQPRNSNWRRRAGRREREAPRAGLLVCSPRSPARSRPAAPRSCARRASAAGPVGGIKE